MSETGASQNSGVGFKVVLYIGLAVVGWVAGTMSFGPPDGGIDKHMRFYMHSFDMKASEAARLAALVSGGGGAVVGIGIAALMAFARGEPREKYFAKPPDGTATEYEYERLREDFLSGKLTPEWVARRQDESVYKPVSEVLYRQE